METGDIPLGAAIMLLKRHGDNAPAYVAQRLGELALADDVGGIAMWKAIAVRMDGIIRPNGLT